MERISSSLSMNVIEDLDYEGKAVLLRVDINSPIDTKTKKIVNENRIKKSIPTIKKILNNNAKLVIIAHQGDTLDYQNLIPMREHAEKLSELTGYKINYIDDVAGPAAQQAVKSLKKGEAILLGNLRYLTEEISTFENSVKLKPEEMLNTFLLRNLAPLVDFYVNDAFAAAHRNAPSMVAFQEVLPYAAGGLMVKEVKELSKIRENPPKPCVFILGGAKISDAFGMMEKVLEDGTADKILTCGITGEIMLLAQGIKLGEKTEKFIAGRGLNKFIKPAAQYLKDYPEKIEFPADLAYNINNKRKEISVDNLPANELFMDIGKDTLENYGEIIKKASTIFVNGPAGVYEQKQFELGTKTIWEIISKAEGYSVIGGGDTVNAASRFINTDKIDYVCTAGGAMVRFLSGVELPLIEAIKIKKK